MTERVEMCDGSGRIERGYEPNQWLVPCHGCLNCHPGPAPPPSQQKRPNEFLETMRAHGHEVLVETTLDDEDAINFICERCRCAYRQPRCGYCKDEAIIVAFKTEARS